jgi:hypothetical protein
MAFCRLQKRVLTMWDWNEEQKNLECFGVLFCHPTNLGRVDLFSLGKTASIMHLHSADPLSAWLPHLPPAQAALLSSCTLQILSNSGQMAEDEQAEKIRDAMQSTRQVLEAMVLAGIRFTGPLFLAGGSLEQPSSDHGRLTLLPPFTFASSPEPISDSEGRLKMAARIHDTIQSRLSGRPRTLVVQKATRSVLESLTISDSFARLYHITTALQELLDLKSPESRVHVNQRLEGVCLSDAPMHPTPIEALLRSFSIRDDYQRLKADAKPIAQRQSQAMEMWMPKLLPFLEALALQMLRRILLRPVLSDLLGTPESCHEYWQTSLARREVVWGEPLLVVPGVDQIPTVAVIDDSKNSGPKSTLSSRQAA